MPITLPALSRRRFLHGALATAGALALAPRFSLARQVVATDPSRLALLSDTHLHADRAHAHETQGNLWDHVRQASDEILALGPKPGAVVINGDCAYLKGKVEDYATVLAALEPMRKAGLPVHLAVGNHDDRANLREALPPDEAVLARDLADRRVLVLPLPHADLYLLDSLEKTNFTPGVLGPLQLRWLAKSLDARGAERPAVLMMHHQPDERPFEKRSGLVDTDNLLQVITPRKQVKAVLFGHTHVWAHGEAEGIHWVNLPATAYNFKEGQPIGWVDALFQERSLRLQLHALVPNHPKDKEVLELAYRA